MPDLKEEYFILLRQYTSNLSEEYLYQAGKLSKKFLESGQGPEEIIQVHMESLEELLKEFSPIRGPGIMLNSFTLLLETMMGYGLTYREYMDIKNRKVDQLETYAKKLEDTNLALEQRVKELAIIQEFVYAIGASMELASTLRLVVNKLGEVIVYDSCSVYLVNQRTEEPLLQLAEGKQSEVKPGLLRKVMDLKEIFIGQDEEYTGCYILIPLLIEKRVIGIINCAGLPSTVFDDHTLKLISIIAAQAAVAIERAMLYEKTREMAFTDEKTGLYNYRAFNLFLDKELQRAERYCRTLSIIMLDIDNFKALNDAYGHPAGDHILKELARLIKEYVRDVDIPARYGGEEFSIILPEANREQAFCVAERLRIKIEQHCFKNREILCNHKLTVSIGISSYPVDGSSKEELIKKADLALYKAKEIGKNKVVIA